MTLFRMGQAHAQAQDQGPAHSKMKYVAVGTGSGTDTDTDTDTNSDWEAVAVWQCGSVCSLVRGGHGAVAVVDDRTTGPAANRRLLA
ncbi:GL17358 [Drosophila persimilis]|uniref:GL17358 n=1 Tax=Drosophila persimilis TaxID=7234 RepID=B4GGJ8_DROPE|nr:GL17358 [Drosophila persimilis]